MFGFIRSVSVPEPQLLSAPPKIDAYVELCRKLGVESPDLRIRKIEEFLVRTGIKVYDYAKVVQYMDRKAEKSQYGWEWRPLRRRDAMSATNFGTVVGGSKSDYYSSENSFYQTYHHLVPAHALEKVLQIETAFAAELASDPDFKPQDAHYSDSKVVRGPQFLVSDYATEPHRLPDPFLLLVFNNAKIKQGAGRYVIDFWDEPGFGIEGER